MSLRVSLSGRIGRSFHLDVDFGIAAQGVTALLGPSGSGKTTVLRAIAGLERVPGTIRFGDEAWQDGRHFVPAHKRPVGYVFQGGGLLPHLTVGRNLIYAARRAPPGAFGCDDVVARTGIGGLMDRIPARLSGGEMQRASIACALLRQPSLLLMDEPLSALDSEARGQFLGHFESLLATLPIPVIYVTHDETEARRLAIGCVRMRAGALDPGGGPLR
ncbi:ATP-binding cassette domain-containing protein [Novosphingobium colocasiae]|uniref:ABC transporter domain-containing protein n=1 Tax=Novosphingobium colocasiae TaxID=1256513 RepID=A0A918PFY5_9SPHN|nr:ATP-binding cassette domain-containing protein [Novosphingobium colocasiae]GGZ03480.1 hypothetical protein GCM10011614_18020 [Novosphingobium colocasiae]